MRAVKIPARVDSGAGDPLLETVEECPPAVSGAFVLFGRHRTALLEEHLCAAVRELVEDDGDQLEVRRARSAADRESEPRRRLDLEVLPLPVDSTAVFRRTNHRQT